MSERPALTRQAYRVWMLGPHPGMRGGISAVATTLLAGGLGQGIQIHYLNTFSDGGLGAKLVRFIWAYLCLFYALLQGRVSLVHAHVSSKSSFWRKSFLLALARGFGVPTVFHLHGGSFAEFTASLGSGLRRRWVRHSLLASDRVVCLSARWQAWLCGFAPDSKVLVIQNPVHVPSDTELASMRGACDGTAPPFVLYLGLISPAKGSFDLLRAWPAVQALAPEWQLKVGGNGDDSALLRLAADLNVSQSLRYLGWVTGDDKQTLIARAGVFVLPSYHEGLPVAVLEAMAFGVPVVCTPVGGVPDIVIDGQEGLLVPVGDPAALAAALLRLASQPALRQALGQAGRRRVLAHNAVPIVVEQWRALYRQLLP